ncbi:MAG TPA: fumarylacetoacetate hydrolase family protein, partial [Candidatus Binatus sp.]|nr:fumarylacetoacetate hydrolase family protein [Candidatus Binatus sp.]
MKILRFNDDRIGVIKNDNMVVDVSDTVSARKAKGPQRVMEEIIDGWRKYRRRFEKILAQQSGVPLSSVALRSPLARPGKFLAAFSNYIDRPERTADNFPNEYFYKSPDLVGPDGEVELRDIPVCVVYQPEAEFAFVMGKTAKDVTEKKALDYVFGYVPMFDISTRGLVRRTQFVGKGQGSHGCCGPWIITKDEIPDPHNVNVKSWTNGEPRQNYNT